MLLGLLAVALASPTTRVIVPETEPSVPIWLPVDDVGLMLPVVGVNR